MMLPTKISSVFFIVLLLAVNLYFAVASDDDSPCSKGSDIGTAPDWVVYGGVIILVVAVIAMFWALALVCEEFFVPALNILCEEAKIPDDVAGATFMAAGASSPELFTSFIALLVYQSNIGVGTVVGSEIFNQMIISAGSVLFAQGGVLYLDSRILCRDLLAYIISLFLLMIALKDDPGIALRHAFDNSQWETCLDVTLAHGGYLLLGYFVYAVICGNYQRLIRMFCPRVEEEKKEEMTEEAEKELILSLNKDETVMHAPYSPRASFTDGPLYQWESSGAVPEIHQSARITFSDRESFAGLRNSIARGTIAPPTSRTTSKAPADSAAMGLEMSEVVNPINRKKMVESKDDKAPNSDDEEEGDVEKVNEGKPAEPTNKVQTTLPASMQYSGAYKMWLDVLGTAPPADFGVMEISPTVVHCYLRIFCDVIKLDTIGKLNMWQLRYFTIDEYGIHSRSDPDDEHTGPHVEIIDLTVATGTEVIDKENLKFQIKFGDKPAVDFIAPTAEIFDVVLKRINAKIEDFKTLGPADKENFLIAARLKLWAEPEHHIEHNLLAVPKGRYSFIWYCIVYPLLFSFHYSLYDVRKEENKKKYGTVIFVSIVYLALLSFIMINCCDLLGDLIGATPTVMGLTLSAIGTSFPNLWSSMVVARQGFGSMAISNALGSNIFNINIALGMPWFVYVLILGGKAYQDMPDHGIVLFIVILQIVNVIWGCMIALAGFRMYAWMAWVFVVMYIAIMAVVIALN